MNSSATVIPRESSMAGRWRRLRHRLRATVINAIWFELVIFTLLAAMVALVSEKTPHSLAISNQMLTVLGTVLGLVVSFRTSSAYERYGEGRKLWTNITVASRNLAYLIWIHVPHDREVKNSIVENEPDFGPSSLRLKAILEKKSMINLIQAFSVSVKHMLRGETGVYYEDLYPLICFLPRYASRPPTLRRDTDVLPLWNNSNAAAPNSPVTSGPTPRVSSPSPSSVLNTEYYPEKDNTMRDTIRSNSLPLEDSTDLHSKDKHRRKKKSRPALLLPVVEADRVLLPARNPPVDTIYDYLPFLVIFKPIFWGIRHAFRKLLSSNLTHNSLTERFYTYDSRSATGKRRPPVYIESHVPLEITLFLSSYFAWLMKQGLLQPAVATGILNNISSLQDSMTNLERIRTTPIPFAYQAHLRMTIWLYLFFLPFQIYDAFSYLTIPATTFASFLLLGFLEIGQEIENPFNYDRNDLDLDLFCLQIQRELHEITAHPSMAPESYIFTTFNQPFAPADRRNAEEIMRDLTHEYHADVDEISMASVRRTLLKSWRDVTDEISAVERRK